MSESLSSTQKKLLELFADSDILIDELYHLQKFNSIVNYNPCFDNVLLNKETESLQLFKNEQNINLWPQPSRRNTRRTVTEHDPKLLQVNEYLDQHLNSILFEKLKFNLRGQKGPKRPIDDTNEKDRPVNKRIKLKISVKPQTITHPSHKPHPKFNSVEDLFGSYNHIIEDPAPEIESSNFDSYIENQIELINKINHAIKDKRLLYVDQNENPFRIVPNGVREPTMIKRNPEYNLNNFKSLEEPFRMKNDLTHYDHLLAQGMKSSKLIHDLRANKIRKCKRIAEMIEVHFKRLSQEKEKQEKEFKKKIVKLAKETAKEVKKKWLVAVKAYKILEERERERERLAKSKEQLSKILDHSTKVLGAQLIGKSPSINNSSIEPEGSGSENDNEDINENESSSDSDDEMLSSSDSDDEMSNSKKLDAEDDSKLTVDQLREKYKHLDDINTEKATSNGSLLTDLYEGKAQNDEDSKTPLTIVEQLTEEERQKILQTEDDNDLILDEDSDSLADSGSDSDSDDDSDDEVDDTNRPTLGSLFNTEVIKSDDDDDDESVYSATEENEKETPSSSPEHDREIMDDNGIPDVPVPILLKGTLRPYQKQGLNWLASLYNNGTNGILADEMGLGKTIQTISLLSYLACEKNIWGPHLIVVPTSVMLNWEMEFKRFAPGFKVMTYYGSPQQRKEKRKGWNTPDKFHVCITSYQLVVHDQPVFRRKKWKYMILDEAHNIKNFRSQRWKSLLNFNTEHRVLLTGTPLQNNIIELWSLLYFLMPSSKEGNIEMPEGFADLMDFQQWFGKPVDKIIQQGGSDNETKETVSKLHQVLRPYLLRRLKQDVEKQMPAKHEHIVYCRLSKRQRLLYDDFMSRAQTKETLASGNFLSIINCLMQLRKVCNHPDLFEVRPILTSFAQEKSVMSTYDIKNKIVSNYLKVDSREIVDTSFVNLVGTLGYDNSTTTAHLSTISKLSASHIFDKKIEELEFQLKGKSTNPNFNNLEEYYDYVLTSENRELLEMMKQRKYVNDFNCNKPQLISNSLVNLLTLKKPKMHVQQLQELDLIKSVSSRSLMMKDTIEKYSFVTPKAVCQDINDLMYPEECQQEFISDSQNDIIENPFHQSQVKLSIAFPDKSLLQYDCGKLQKLAQILHDIIPQGHRVLIFTQMSKVLDILELFLNYHGYTYMRLDGATRIEDRQLLTERFNNDTRVKCFILSTRAGGLGINLTGADTVIFYDSDWNPAIDKQCQDRCHRIGQTRDVHIYRFVSEYTIEANILKKAEQKKHLDNVIIQDGDFTTDYFNKITVNDLLGKPTDDDEVIDVEAPLIKNRQEFTKALEQAEDDDDAKAAEMAMRETNVDVEDFSDDEKNVSITEIKQDVKENVEEVVEAESLARRIAHREGHKTPNGDVKGESGMEASESMEVNKNTELEEHVHPNEGNEDGYEEKEEDGDGDDDDDDDIGHVDEYMIRFIAGGYYFD